MTYEATNRPERNSRKGYRKLAGGGLAAAILAGLWFGFQPDPTDTVAQKQRPTDVQLIRLDARQRVGQVAESPTEPLTLAVAKHGTTTAALIAMAATNICFDTYFFIVFLPK